MEDHDLVFYINHWLKMKIILKFVSHTNQRSAEHTSFCHKLPENIPFKDKAHINP